MKKQVGFTLIELIIVIVILGILAAYAVPKYMSLDKEARIAAIRGLSGSVHAASDLVHAVAIAKGSTGTSTNVNIGDVNVDFVAAGNFYAAGTATGINRAISDVSGFTPTYAGGVATYTRAGGTDTATCNVTYDTTTAVPTINYNTGGC